MRDYLIICFVILVFVIDVVKKNDFFTKIKIIFSPLRSDTCCFFIPFFRVCNRIFGESTIITQLQREHRRFVQKIGARQRVKIAGTRAANWKGRKKLRHARRRHGSDNTCLETFIY